LAIYLKRHLEYGEQRAGDSRGFENPVGLSLPVTVNFQLAIKPV
jgi:hypothetical protein